MEIYPLGLSSFKIKGKAATVVTDPYDPEVVGLKFPKVENVDIITISHDHPDHNHLASLGDTSQAFVASGPGEYEARGVTIIGVASFHDSESGKERGKNVIYKMNIDGVKVCHLGDLGHKLTDDQMDQIGEVDILMLPVGGGYTIDAKVAAEVAAKMEAKVIIPMHYFREGMGKTFEGKIEGVEHFLKEMGAEGGEKQNRFSATPEKLPENTTVIVLE